MRRMCLIGFATACLWTVPSSASAGIPEVLNPEIANPGTSAAFFTGPRILLAQPLGNPRTDIRLVVEITGPAVDHAGSGEPDRTKPTTHLALGDSIP